MKSVLRRWRILLGSLGALVLIAYAVLLVLGARQPLMWSTDVFGGGTIVGTQRVVLAPFPPLSDLQIFDLNARQVGRHFYLLGSDPGGRDLLALVARASLPSLLLVALVVVLRTLVGLIAGALMASGSSVIRLLSRGVGDWVVGFPYLALAIILVDAFAPRGRLLAFVVAMSFVGWRDVAEVVADRIDYVRTQPFSMGAAALGTTGLRYLQLHVVPHLRPALAIEVVFQCSAVLVLLAELGYLQIYLGPVFRIRDPGANTIPLTLQPELGQLLGNSRMYILYRQLAPFLVPALSIAVLALGFELLGSAMRGRWRITRRA